MGKSASTTRQASLVPARGACVRDRRRAATIVATGNEAGKMLFQYLLLVLLVLVIVQLKKIRKNFMDVHRLIKVSSPDIPVIGHSYKFIGTNEDIADPVSATVVLKSCLDKRPISLLARHLVGNGSVFGDEEIWRLRRKIFMPIFAPKYYEEFVHVFERNNKIMIEELASVVNKGDFSIWGYFSSYAFDSALEMTFGENINAQKNGSHPFLEAFQDYFKNVAARICQPWLYSNAVYSLLPVAARQSSNKKIIWDYVETLIHKKKTAFNKEKLQDEANNYGEREQRTFLELLVESSRGAGGYSAAELREETLVLALAAADTSAAAACFAAVLLAHCPRAQRRLRQEVEELLGDSKRSVSVGDLAQLKYLDAVVKEFLRLYPPVPVTVRQCNTDLQLPSGITLPEGCQVICNIWGIHRNPHCWGADADEFRPERFLSATPQQLAAFMPFSHGPRNCAGARLAMASLKLSVAELTRRYQLAPAASYEYSKLKPLRVTFDIVLKHVHNFEVQLQNRC
ncbi:cytochrome P450 4d8-like [Pararge aegeria]|uniref:cytochrome P450 4d8-like n=1 Tax=Pararge aegeria TaxID=116150 RepID=UPI0019D2D526|nr:cytochrome P450 4d8-like [Pararge aegeria]